MREPHEGAPSTMKMTWQGAAAARVTRVDNNNRIILLKKMNGIYVGNIKTMLSSSFGPPPETWDVQKSVELWRSEVRKTAMLQTGMRSVRIVHDADTESWAVVPWSGGEQPPVVEEKQIVLDPGTKDLAIVTSNGGAQPSIPELLMKRFKQMTWWIKIPPTQSPTPPETSTPPQFTLKSWDISADGNTQLPEIDYHGDISYNVRFAKAFTWFQTKDVINKPFVEEADSEITKDYDRLFTDMVSVLNNFDFPTTKTKKITEMAQFIMRTVPVDGSKKLRNFEAWNHGTKFGEIEKDVKIYEGRELPAIIGYLMIYTSGDENQNDIFKSIKENFLNTIESFIGKQLIDGNRFSDTVMNDKITQIINNTSITDDDPLIRAILKETYMRQASPFFVHTMLRELDPNFKIFERDIDGIFFIIKEGKTCDAIRAIANIETYFAKNPSIKESILSDYLADPNDETIVYGTDENVDDIKRVIRELEVHFLPSLTWLEKISLYWSKDAIFVWYPGELFCDGSDGDYILNEDAPPELVLKKLKQIMANRTTPTKTPEVKIELTIENILKGFMSEPPGKRYYTFKHNDNPIYSKFLITMHDLSTKNFVKENDLINAVSYIIQNLQEEQKPALRFWGDVTQTFVLDEGNWKLRKEWYYQTEKYKQYLEAFIFGYMFVSKKNFIPNDFYDSIKTELVDSFKVTNSATISNNGFFESSYPLLNFTLKDIVETVKSTTRDDKEKIIRYLVSKYENFIVNILPLLLRKYMTEINEELINIIKKNGILFEEQNGILSVNPPKNPTTESVILCLYKILNSENEHEKVMKDAERTARETKRTEEAERKKAEKAAEKAKLKAEALELQRKQNSKSIYIKSLIKIRSFNILKTLVNSNGFSIDKLNDADSSDVIAIANNLNQIIPQEELKGFNSTDIVQRGWFYWSVRHNIEAIKAVVESFITGGEGADTAAPQTSSATPAPPATPAPQAPPTPQTQTANKKASATPATQKPPAQNEPDTGGPSVTTDDLSGSMEILRLKGQPAYTAQYIRDVIKKNDVNKDFNNYKSKINKKDTENIVSNLDKLLNSDETLKNKILEENSGLFKTITLKGGTTKQNLFTNCSAKDLGLMIRLIKEKIQ